MMPAGRTVSAERTISAGRTVSTGRTVGVLPDCLNQANGTHLTFEVAPTQPTTRKAVEQTPKHLE